MSESDLNVLLVVGARVRIGEKYSEETPYFKPGEIITLIEGEFDHDNGLYSEIQTAPAIWNEQAKDFDSIYHLFGNNLEDFADCEVLDN
ncbi:MAG: hypothetical protein KDA17_05920 [Candidatus Saccharibacteria bacterium]|nr:hypothetical protein [Candidatus Saccharibacteria bacterium]